MGTDERLNESESPSEIDSGVRLTDRQTVGV
jgi:hypothetical protein